MCIIAALHSLLFKVDDGFCRIIEVYASCINAFKHILKIELFSTTKLAPGSMLIKGISPEVTS